MKKYSKAKMIAKNLPTGSYAAGCPSSRRPGSTTYSPAECQCCETTR